MFFSVNELSVDPLIASLDELNAAVPIRRIGIPVLWDRWSVEVIKWHEEVDRRIILGDEILQQKEVHVPAEVLEQCEELAISRKRLSEWTALAQVVPTDAF